MVTLPRQVSHPRAAGYGARLGDLYVRLGASVDFPVRLVTDDSLAERQESGVQSVNTYENLMKLGFVFSRFDLSGGEGLDVFPRPSQAERTELDALRFWDSSGIAIDRAVDGNPPGLRVARGFESKIAGTALGDITASSTQIIVADGTDIEVYDGWADTSATVIAVAVDIDAIAASPDGDIAAVDSAGSVWVSLHGAAVSEELDGAVDDPAVGVWYAKGRFLATTQPTAGGAELVEIVVGGANIVVDTARDDFLSVIDSGMAIVAANRDGTLRTYVPQTDTAGAAPVLTQRAQTPMPPGETPYGLGWNAGVLVIKTAEIVGSDTTTRIYQAEVLDARFDYLVGNQQLRRTWSGTSETIGYLDGTARTRDEIFWTIRESATTTSMWRMDVVSGGISRYNDVVTASEVPIGLIFVDDSLGLVVDDEVHWQSTLYDTEGWLITSKINFGLHTAINWVAAILDARDLEASGSQVELYYSLDPDAIKDKDDASWRLIWNYTTDAQMGNEISILGATSNEAVLQVRIYSSSTGTDSPLVTRFAIRALPKHRDWIIDLPVNVSDMITARGRKPAYRNGWGDKVREELLKMQGDQIELSVFKPPLLMRGIIDAIGEPFTYISKRGSAGRVCTVRFRGLRLGIGSSMGAAGMGVSPMGIGTMGINQLGE